MTEGRIVFDSKKPLVRIFMLVAVAVSVVACFLGVRWQLGDMLGELTSPTDPNVSSIAEVAGSFAPRDPRAKWLAAMNEANAFSLESIDAAAALFGETVRLSPGDYRWWIEYGRSLEQAGRFDESEAALAEAVKAAPNFAHPHWQLGNFYLRQGRIDEAFRELNLAARNDGVYRNQVFALVWDYFGNDPSILERIASSSIDARADLALFYAYRFRAADALRVWNMIPEPQKGQYARTAKLLTQLCSQHGAFREGVEFSRQAGIDPEARAEQISNSGFETMLKDSDDTYFDWKIDRSDGKADFSPDTSVQHSGKRSLRATFRNYDRPQLYRLWQNVAVEPNTKYALAFWVRTESLRSGGPPLIEVVNPSDGKLLSASRAFPLGTNEWQRFTVEFTTPDTSEGIVVRTSREYCGETCPMIGLVWLDDFDLSKL